MLSAADAGVQTGPLPVLRFEPCEPAIGGTSGAEPTEIDEIDTGALWDFAWNDFDTLEVDDEADAIGEGGCEPKPPRWADEGGGLGEEAERTEAARERAAPTTPLTEEAAHDLSCACVDCCAMGDDVMLEPPRPSPYRGKTARERGRCAQAGAAGQRYGDYATALYGPGESAAEAARRTAVEAAQIRAELEEARRLLHQSRQADAAALRR